MSSVVIVHTDPRSTIELLESAGFHVQVAGTSEVAGPVQEASGHNWSTRQGVRQIVSESDVTPTLRTVLIVTAVQEVAA